jgi:hypothetical protein
MILMNILLLLLRILAGIILIIGLSIGYIFILLISITIIAHIIILLCGINIIFYDIIKSLTMIMLLGMYDINN